MKKYVNMITGLAVILLSGLIYLASNSIQKMVITSIGPDFMPKLVALIMGILGVILTLQGVVSLSRARREAAPEPQEKKRSSPAEIFKSHLDLVTLLLLVLYAVFLTEVGFLISTTIYLFLQITIMPLNKKRNYWVISLVSVVFSCSVYFLFTKVLYVMLPAGLLG